MNLQEIAKSLPDKYRDWGNAHLKELEETSTNPAISSRVVDFIHEAIDSPHTRTGNPLTATQNALRLASFANFRFGLLIGILLYAGDGAGDANKPAPLLLPDDGARPCPDCLGIGLICIHCGLVKFDCSCEAAYSPVDCDTCNGSGELKTEEEG